MRRRLAQSSPPGRAGVLKNERSHAREAPVVSLKQLRHARTPTRNLGAHEITNKAQPENPCCYSIRQDPTL